MIQALSVVTILVGMALGITAGYYDSASVSLAPNAEPSSGIGTAAGTLVLEGRLVEITGAESFILESPSPYGGKTSDLYEIRFNSDTGVIRGVQDSLTATLDTIAQSSEKRLRVHLSLSSEGTFFAKSIVIPITVNN